MQVQPLTLLGGGRTIMKSFHIGCQPYKIMYPDVLDIRCISHTLDLVGDKFKTPNLILFFTLWLSYFAHSSKLKALWKTRTGRSVATYSQTWWWSRWENHEFNSKLGNFFLCTVGSRLSEHRLSISGHLDVDSGRRVFGTSGKKTLQSLAFCYRRKQSFCTNDFPERYNTFFNAVQDLDHDLQRPSKLSETTNTVVHCITAWQIKRQGK